MSRTGEQEASVLGTGEPRTSARVVRYIIESVSESPPSEGGAGGVVTHRQHPTAQKIRARPTTPPAAFLPLRKRVRSTPRRGFTLIELIVVIAIIALLIAILLPAVQMVRAAARSTQCRNHLKQLGLAVHNYLDVHRGFPIGNVPTRFWTGQSMLLPHLDQSALYAQLDYDYDGIPADCFAALDAAAPNDPGKTLLPVFQCPSDPNAGKVNTKHFGWGSHVPTDYLGVSGTSVAARDGLFYSGSFVRGGDVRDGFSTTLAFGERGIPADLEQGWVLCGAGSNPVGSGNQDNHLSMAIGIRPGSNDTAHDTHFWSWHSGGAHFALADGSVRFFSNSTDLTALQRLATRAGNDVVGEF
jgi:prepilin-type N-terminal cleavage/methylation domain-containing protein/prepilin-type processing-associated H-X9-DG protein